MADRPSILTDRQAAVLRLLADGVEPREVARHLGITPATVRGHLQRALAKLVGRRARPARTRRRSLDNRRSGRLDRLAALSPTLINLLTRETQAAARDRLPFGLLLVATAPERPRDPAERVAPNPMAKAVLATLRCSVRRQDSVAPLAEDEFLVILRGSDEAGAQRVVNRLHVTMARTDLAVGATQLRPGENVSEALARLSGAVRNEKLLRTSERSIQRATTEP